MDRPYRATQSLETLDRKQTIVHLHGYTKTLTTTPALATRRACFAVICTLHDFFAACPNGAFFDYRRNAPALFAHCRQPASLTNCDERHGGPSHVAGARFIAGDACKRDAGRSHPESHTVDRTSRSALASA